MLDLDHLNEMWQTIARNKTRSLLTAFGVFWGVFLLAVLSATGNGFENGLRQQVEGFATNTTMIYTDQTEEPYKGYQTGRYWEMSYSDVEILKASIPEIAYISPTSYLYASDDNVIYQEKHGNYGVKGVLPDYNEIDRSKILKGRFINETDIKECRKVCLLGKRVYEETIGKGVDPLNALVKVNGVYFTVVGVIRTYNDNFNFGGSNNNSVFLPLTTMQKVFNLGDEIDNLTITAKEGTRISSIEENIMSLIKERHDISPTDPSAVQCFNMEEEFDMFNAMFLGVHILIWIVGLGTLLSGVVGVSNIMLVTVKERVCEIGIRRALGAKPKSIVRQVLSESLLLTVLAGVVGLCIGVGIMIVVALIVEANPSENVMFQDPQIRFNTAVIALCIVVLSGMVAGILPALRAIQIKAIDAIREE